MDDDHDLVADIDFDTLIKIVKFLKGVHRRQKLTTDFFQTFWVD